MEYRKIGDTYALRLDRGEEMLASLIELCRKENVRLGTVEGLGAADHVVVGLYNVGSHEYHKTELNGPMEITSLAGSVTRKDGEPYLHLHINVCGQDMHVCGGHLNECRISATAEVFIRELPGEIGRFFDEKVTGLNIFCF